MRKFLILAILVMIAIILGASLREAVTNKPEYILSKIMPSADFNPSNLVYKVNYADFLPAGKAEINFLGEEKMEGKNVYHISATAWTLDIIKPLFVASARIDSYIDRDRMHTIKYVESTKIKGKNDKTKTITYDQQKHSMIYKGEERVIEPDTQDPLSAIFYIRNQNLNVGKEFNIYFNTNQRIYIMATKVLAKNTYKIKGKEFCVWVVNAKLKRADGNPYHKTDLKLYLLDNKTKTPLIIKVFSGAGIISTSLIEAK